MPVRRSGLCRRHMRGHGHARRGSLTGVRTALLPLIHATRAATQGNSLLQVSSFDTAFCLSELSGLVYSLRFLSCLWSSRAELRRTALERLHDSETQHRDGPQVLPPRLSSPYHRDAPSAQMNLLPSVVEAARTNVCCQHVQDRGRSSSNFFLASPS